MSSAPEAARKLRIRSCGWIWSIKVLRLFSRAPQSASLRSLPDGRWIFQPVIMHTNSEIFPTYHDKLNIFPPLYLCLIFKTSNLGQAVLSIITNLSTCEFGREMQEYLLKVWNWQCICCILHPACCRVLLFCMKFGHVDHCQICLLPARKSDSSCQIRNSHSKYWSSFDFRS